MIRSGSRALIALALLTSVNVPAFSQVECPPSTLYCLSERTTTAVRDSMSCFTSDERRVGEILIDHRQGYASLAGGRGDYVASPRLIASDDFRVTGLPPGIPVTVTAHFRGYLRLILYGPGFYSHGSVQVRLTESASNTTSDQMSGSYFDGCPSCFRFFDLSIAIATTTDQVFRVAYAEECDVLNGSAFANGTLSFSGLAPGAVVTSCKGFQQDAPTPTVPVSWGGLKIRYR